MYEYIWDQETGGLLLTTNVSKFSKEPRPVYYKELDILGFDEYWNYPKDDSAPLMWAEANNYIYFGRNVAKTKGGSLYTKPEIVILDEPFSGLDPVNSQILKDCINELIADNKLVIFSSHQMSYVEEFCEDIAIVNKGEIILSGNLKDIKKKFGENRLVLSACNYSLEKLKEVCENNFSELVDVNEVKKEFIVLELKKDISKKQLLLALINSGVDIEKFGEYEPTLTDIFVLKAGDNNE